MADTAYLIPGGGIVVDTEQDEAELIPGLGIYVEQAGAIMNQLQSANLGADLYNGTLL